MKSKQSTWRRLVLVLLLAGFAFVLLVAGARTPSVAMSFQGRQVVEDLPKNVPLKVKLKAEKEPKFKDLSNPDWLGDFELEVTNTSDRPIYFLEFWLMLPETRTPDNNPIAFSLRYGRSDFIRLETLRNDMDVPIKPGEMYTFTIQTDEQQGWHKFKSKGDVPDPARVKIHFVQLSFGDGTGFQSGGAVFPPKRSQLSDNSCREGPKNIQKGTARNTRSAFATLREQPSSRKPVLNVPANFLVKSSYVLLHQLHQRTLPHVGPRAFLGSPEFVIPVGVHPQPVPSLIVNKESRRGAPELATAAPSSNATRVKALFLLT